MASDWGGDSGRPEVGIVALTAGQWLEREFFPVLSSTPGLTDEQPEEMKVLQAVIGLRLMGALDALSAVGALTAEQQSRCQAALEAKGLKEERRVITSVGTLVAGTATIDSGEDATPVDRLQRVVAVNRVVGLIEDEPCVLTALEIWQHSVHAHLLIDVGPQAAAEQHRHAAELTEWIRARDAGETTDADRPSLGLPHGFPGRSVTWVVEAAGRRARGRLMSGHGDSQFRRLEIAWDLTLPDDCTELVLIAEDGDQVTGRVAVDL